MNVNRQQTQQTNNDFRRYIITTTMDKVAQSLASLQHAPLNVQDKKMIISSLDRADFAKFNGMTYDDVSTKLAETLSKKIVRLRQQIRADNEQYDMQSYLRDQLGTDPEQAVSRGVSSDETLGSILNKPYVLRSIINPRSLYRKTYLLLDSRHRIRDGDYLKLFKWNLASAGSNYDPETSAVSTSPLTNIVAIKMFPFRFPNSWNAVTSVHRLAVSITELNNQAFVMYGGARAHFFFDINRSTITDVVDESGTTVNYPQYICSDIGNSVSEYNFSQPVQALTTMTLSFYNPYQQITFDPDIITGATLSVASTGTRITFPFVPYLANYDDVIISGFVIRSAPGVTSTNVNDVAAMAQINDVAGWAITIVTASIVTINVDLSHIVGTIDNSKVVVYLNSKRITLRLELTYIEAE